jgi:hypothetical protein
MALSFRIVQSIPVEGADWLQFWESEYDKSDGPESNDVKFYAELIARNGDLSSEDIHNVGRWKDQAWTEGRWKVNVASVARLGWEQLSNEKCPQPTELVAVLERWSESTYEDQQSTGRIVRKRFGLSRATTLLHFLSGGEYPILDSRVFAAIRRLDSSLKPDSSAKYYVDKFLPWFRQLKEDCGFPTTRSLDKALFAFGAATLPVSIA